VSVDAIRPSGQASSPTSGPAYWREALAPYAKASLARSCADILTSGVAYLVVSVGMVFALKVSVWLTLALAPLSAACLLRSFIVFHDCTHGSFMRSSRANVWLGNVFGVIVLTPFVRWRYDHAVHHGTSGDLDRRGIGDLPTLTVEEYEARSPRGRLEYRLFRNPVIMLGIGPLIAMIIGPRLVARDAPARMQRSVLVTDAALAVIMAGVVWVIGPIAFLLMWLPAALLAGAAGIWLFYAQHQFEDSYWRRSDDWSYAEAALQGSSFLDLHPVLRYVTGNIGYHHVHHLSVRIPNYHLKRAHERSGLFDSVPVLTLGDGLRALRLKLWDEQAGRMVTFVQAQQSQAQRTRALTSPAPELASPGPEFASSTPEPA
jgi:omega-6 fatty acid desaturase (delta-12 desaturase)